MREDAVRKGANAVSERASECSDYESKYCQYKQYSEHENKHTVSMSMRANTVRMRAKIMTVKIRVRGGRSKVQIEKRGAGGGGYGGELGHVVHKMTHTPLGIAVYSHCQHNQSATTDILLSQ